MMTMVTSKEETMSERAITATQFKAQCLGLLDEVAATGDEILVTKHGRPVARVVAIIPPESLTGSVTQLVSDDELIAPLGEVWNAEQA
jgi:prevent-host-death family protein